MLSMKAALTSCEEEDLVSGEEGEVAPSTDVLGHADVAADSDRLPAPHRLVGSPKAEQVDRPDRRDNSAGHARRGGRPAAPVKQKDKGGATLLQVDAPGRVDSKTCILLSHPAQENAGWGRGGQGRVRGRGRRGRRAGGEGEGEGEGESWRRRGAGRESGSGSGSRSGSGRGRKRERARG
eukprot:3164267-Pleurochrysis_carterae.AAC.4